MLHKLTASKRIGSDGSRSKQAPFPFARNVTVDTIAGLADRLWKDLVGSGSKQDGSLPYPVTTIAIGFSGVEPGEIGQQNIEGFFLPGASTKPPSPSSPDGHNNETIRIHRRKRLREEGDDEGSSLGVQGIGRENVASFVCTRCHKRIEIELGDDVEGEPEERRTRALTRLRLEHNDFHFAEDMAKMPDDGNVSRSPGLRAVERERKRKKDTRAGKDRPQDVEGIAKFLVRRPG